MKKKWCMKFNPDKCTVLNISNKKKNLENKYQLHGHILQTATSAKYLGLTFTNKLHPSTLTKMKQYRGEQPDTLRLTTETDQVSVTS